MDRSFEAIERVALGAVLLAALLGCKLFGDKSEPTPASTAATTTTPQSIGASAVNDAGTVGAADAQKKGDRISVRWQGKCYAARILQVAKPGVYFITYEGYDHSWDETITTSRICR